MTVPQNIESIKKIILNPAEAWKDIKSIKISKQYFYIVHVLFVMGIIFIARMVGKSLELLAVSSIYYIFLYSFFSLMCDFASFFIAVKFINKLLPSYTDDANEGMVIYLIYYSLIPYYFSVFFISLFPSMYFFGVISLYGLLIFWLGIRTLFDFKNNDYTIFFVISAIIILGIHLLLRFIVILPFFTVL